MQAEMMLRPTVSPDDLREVQKHTTMQKIIKNKKESRNLNKQNPGNITPSYRPGNPNDGSRTPPRQMPKNYKK
jgi:hypothetical protein